MVDEMSFLNGLHPSLHVQPWFRHSPVMFSRYLLGKHVYTYWVLVSLCPKFNLSQDLVGERVAHDERRVAHSTAKVRQTSLSKQNDMAAIGEFIAVNLKSKVDTLTNAHVCNKPLHRSLEVLGRIEEKDSI